MLQENVERSVARRVDEKNIPLRHDFRYTFLLRKFTVAADQYGREYALDL